MKLDDIIRRAYNEDLPEGDLTTDSLKIESWPGTATLLAKENLIFSGRDIFEACVKFLDPECEVQWSLREGDFIEPNQPVAQLSGNLIPLLKAERVALNFVGRFSGIATLTRRFVDKVAHTKCKILDTRKTTPGLRFLEKQAVIHGGGHSHRANLSAAILIKENHIQVAGGLIPAIQRIRQNSQRPIEVEVKNLEEVQLAKDLSVERVLLDNMNNETIRKALKILPSTVQTEASGNMTLDRVASVANLGVNFISVGALTHSAPCADLSLLFQGE